jgi:hypothetical protein
MKIRTALMRMLHAALRSLGWRISVRERCNTISNSPAGNAVLVFERAANGALSPTGALPTGSYPARRLKSGFGLVCIETRESV